MPMHSHAPHSSRNARNGEPQPAPPPSSSEPASTKRDLTSWWRQFGKRSTVKKDDEREPEPRGIFGVPLITSIPYANVAISLFNESGESYIYGYVPIVVAKCGVFLKEKATDVEGIFRLAGSEKRIKELKLAFDTPPRWGKGLDWTGYTVHDAANILRRYFNQLPEPIIPLEKYDAFREPLRGHQAEAVGPIEGQAPSTGDFKPDETVRRYQLLIKELPSLNRQLLLYILDLLAVFAAKSDINKMTTSNLAAIFQPGILSHPQHDMSPQDYRLSQDVLIFLIDNQDHFLIGMEGTAVDEGTAKVVQSGPPTPQARTPTRNKSGIGRSASAASSAAAESIRKFGGVRRNVSTSSRQSRQSGAVPSPIAPSFSTPTGSGVHRSNTVPSKRSPAIRSTPFSQDKSSDPPTPSRTSLATERPTDTLQPLAPTITPEPEISAQPEVPAKAAEQKNIAEEKLDVVGPLPDEKAEFSRPTPSDIPGAYPLPSPDIFPPDVAAPSAPAPAVAAQSLAPPPMPRHGGPSPQHTPVREKSEFVEGPLDSGSPVDPSPAVRTFTQILAKVSPSNDEKKDGRKPNKLQKKPRVPSSSNPSAHSSTASLGFHSGVESTPSPLPALPAVPQQSVSGTKEAPHPPSADTVSSRNSGATLKPSMSPSASMRSHSTTTEYSEAEPPEEPAKEEKRSFWRGHRRGESKATVTPTASQSDLSRSVAGATQSMSSFGSSSGRGERRSLQYDSKEANEVYSSPEKDAEKKSAFGWFSRHKDRDAKKRAKSPSGSTSELVAQPLVQPFGPQESANSGARESSMDVPRTVPEERESGKESNDVTPTGTSSKALLADNTSAAPAPATSGNAQPIAATPERAQAQAAHAPVSQFPPAPPPYKNPRDHLPIP